MHTRSADAVACHKQRRGWSDVVVAADDDVDDDDDDEDAVARSGSSRYDRHSPSIVAPPARLPRQSSHDPTR